MVGRLVKNETYQSEFHPLPLLNATLLRPKTQNQSIIHLFAVALLFRLAEA